MAKVNHEASEVNAEQGVVIVDGPAALPSRSPPRRQLIHRTAFLTARRRQLVSGQPLPGIPEIAPSAVS